MSQKTIRGGDLVFNIKTGEIRLVIEYSPSNDEITFSRDPKWYSARDWRTNFRPIFT